MIKIAFVCHGNICRSVMAEYILKDFLEKNKIENIIVDSFAVSREEIGNSIYPPAKSCLIKHKINIGNHKAKQLTKDDYKYFDEIYYMDEANRRYLDFICKDVDNKYIKLLNRDVSDPWYTRDFDKCYLDICEGIEKIKRRYSL